VKVFLGFVEGARVPELSGKAGSRQPVEEKEPDRSGPFPLSVH
jgi:hypothetical protein